MRILFLGGNGNISWWCSKKCLEKGHMVWELNRGQSWRTRRSIPDEIFKIKCDIHNKSEVIKFINNLDFDCIVDFICYNYQDAKDRYEIFRDKTNNYIFISTDGIYDNKNNILITENTALKQEKDMDQYTLAKREAEKFFLNIRNKEKFPITIVRPSYTYDTILPCSIGHNCFTVARMALNGYPLLIAGSGKNKWTFTHSSDFADLMLPLIEQGGNGQIFNVVGGSCITQRECIQLLLSALKLPIDDYLTIDLKKLNKGNLGIYYDGIIRKTRNQCFDNTKIISFSKNWRQRIDINEGINKTVEWFLEDKIRERYNSAIEKIVLNLIKNR